MNNFANLSQDIRAKADQVIEFLGLDGFSVTYKANQKALHFRKGLKEMSVALALIERGQWADIKQAYRAVFLPGPQVENFSGHNEWSRSNLK